MVTNEFNETDIDDPEKAAWYAEIETDLQDMKCEDIRECGILKIELQLNLGFQEKFTLKTGTKWT